MFSHQSSLALPPCGGKAWSVGRWVHHKLWLESFIRKRFPPCGSPGWNTQCHLWGNRCWKEPVHSFYCNAMSLSLSHFLVSFFFFGWYYTVFKPNFSVFLHLKKRLLVFFEGGTVKFSPLTLFHGIKRKYYENLHYIPQVFHALCLIFPTHK